MRDEIVALDLETTGLDIAKDAIIEVGAVRMKEGQIVDTFSTLVNPGFDIPADVVHLTGIHPEDVVSAPTIAEVIPKVQAFVGDAPIIAHNVGFDVGFLRRHGILKHNLGIDTFDIAAILLPRSARYTLSSLTHELGIKLENAHRALDDAHAAALLYWQLWQKLLTLPYTVLAEIVYMARGLPDWETGYFFQAGLKAHDGSGKTDELPLFSQYVEEESLSEPLTTIHRIDERIIDKWLGEDGLLSARISGYEYRPQQAQIARAIASAFNEGRHLLIEAGTGAGKSLAYLLPSILWAIQNRERVVISTNTINLQEQLINKDIPLLADCLDTPFRSAVLKGRGNYLCPRRLSVFRQRPVTSVDELRVMAKVLVWLLETTTGDKGEISLRGREHVTWQRLSAEDEGCSLNRCHRLMQGICPFYKARRRAEAAHLVIVNHALLITDAASENRVLPDYAYLIVDEAHQLEEAITNGMTFRVDKTALLRRLDDLGSVNKGMLGELLLLAQQHIAEKDYHKLETYALVIGEATDVMRALVHRLFKALMVFLTDIHAITESDYQPNLRIVDEHRGRAAFAQVRGVWNTLHEYFDALSDRMHHLTRALKRFQDDHIPGFNDLTNSTEAVASYLNDTNRELQAFFSEPDPNRVYWINLRNRDDEPAILSAPLHVGPMMEQYLWQVKESVILTSATLQTESSFDYIRERLFADDADTLDVGSPFNYKESTLLYIPTDIPEPNAQKGYQRAIERGIIELAAALGGRVLVLFTSYSHLRETAQNITPRLALGNITVYDQIDGSSREALLRDFKANEQAVLLGTKSFWQGVDVPGDALSALVIVRLPFAVPNEPIFAARSETYNDPFKEYAVPEAILQFRQGFGRLIRTRTDVGVVAIFDSRITTKSYGARFLESLPDCTIQYGPLELLAKTAQEWLQKPLSNS